MSDRRAPGHMHHNARLTGMALLVAAAVVVTADAAEAAGSRNGQTAEKRAARRAQTSHLAPKSAAPATPLQIMVSLNQQRLTVYQDGVAVTSSAISSGQSGYGTPTGIYTILQKSRYHESNIYSGAPMPYMQRITWSGIALHEGHLPGYPASHGCIRLPGAFAGSLFALTKVGARVVVSREPLTPQPIEHDLLADLSQRPLSTLTERVASPAPLRLGEPAFAGGLIVSAASASPAPAPGDDAAPVSVTSVTSLEELQAMARPEIDGQVAILISRQTSKIYIRRNFQPVFESEVIIHDSERPLGTHLFTAMGSTADGRHLTWNVVSFPGDAPRAATGVGKSRKSRVSDAGDDPEHFTAATAPEALSRIEFDEDVLEEIAEIARPGMSLIITDRGPGSETGKGTEFVIQPR